MWPQPRCPLPREKAPIRRSACLNGTRTVLPVRAQPTTLEEALVCLSEPSLLRPPIALPPPLREGCELEWYRNINLLSIGFALRLRLRPD